MLVNSETIYGQSISYLGRKFAPRERGHYYAEPGLDGGPIRIGPADESQSDQSARTDRGCSCEQFLDDAGR